MPAARTMVTRRRRRQKTIDRVVYCSVISVHPPEHPSAKISHEKIDTFLICDDVSLGTFCLPDRLGPTSISSSHYCCRIHQMATVSVAGRDNALSVKVSWWRLRLAQGVLIIFRILSDGSGSNACIDGMDWSVLNTLCKVIMIYCRVITVTKLY